MIFSHDVKHNGKWYSAGTNVPVEVLDPADFEKEPVMVMADDYEEEPQKRYTKSEILGMRKADLIKVAKENGISEADDMTGSELKTALVKVLNL